MSYICRNRIIFQAAFLAKETMIIKKHKTQVKGSALWHGCLSHCLECPQSIAAILLFSKLSVCIWEGR